MKESGIHTEASRELTEEYTPPEALQKIEDTARQGKLVRNTESVNKLIVEAKTGSDEARDQLFFSKLYLVYALVDKYATCPQEYEEFLAEGFAATAELLDSIHENDEELSNNYDLYQRLYTKLRRCFEDLAESGGNLEENEEPVDYTEETGFESTVSGPEEAVLKLVAKDELERALGAINPRDARVISGRFHEDKTFIELGKELGVSPERVRQMESRGLCALRHPYRSERLKTFLIEGGDRGEVSELSWLVADEAVVKAVSDWKFDLSSDLTSVEQWAIKRFFPYDGKKVVRKKPVYGGYYRVGGEQVSEFALERIAVKAIDKLREKYSPYSGIRKRSGYRRG